MRSPQRGEKGFTLLELMIVIGIIGILAAIMIPMMMRARFKTYHTACVQNVRNIATALELYSLEHEGLYPTQLITLTTTARPYISHIETCPSNGVDYTVDYAPAPDNKEYVLPCPGLHENQLPGVVEDTYPQAVNGRIDPDRAP